MNFGERKIEASNLPELDSFEKSKVESALIASFDKMQKIVNKEMLLNAHFKQHEAEGTRKKSSVHLKLNFPGKTIVSSDSGWDVLAVLQNALKMLERATLSSAKKR
jgi:ribosome-associated translation inhibitor RaiA